MKLIIQIGLKRSGNHGILNLIKKNFDKTKIVHLNDLQKFTYDQYYHFSNIEITLNETNNLWAGFKNADLLLISLENKIINQTLLQELNQIQPNPNIIILLRNPYNNAASALQYFLKIGETHAVCTNKYTLIRQLVEQWKIYARFLLSQREKNITPIIYDKFYQDEIYRKDVFSNLGLSYEGTYLNQIVGWGQSFFDRNCKDASKMNIFRRFLYFSDHPFFITKIFRDEELLLLWENICIKFQIEIDQSLMNIVVEKRLSLEIQEKGVNAQ